MQGKNVDAEALAMQRASHFAEYGRNLGWDADHTNNPIAAAWFEKAASLGNARAMFVLGGFYFNGVSSIV